MCLLGKMGHLTQGLTKYYLRTIPVSLTFSHNPVILLVSPILFDGFTSYVEYTVTYLVLLLEIDFLDLQSWSSDFALYFPHCFMDLHYELHVR